MRRLAKELCPRTALLWQGWLFHHIRTYPQFSSMTQTQLATLSHYKPIKLWVQCLRATLGIFGGSQSLNHSIQGGMIVVIPLMENSCF